MGVNAKQTLCWDCANATGGSNWSDHWKHSPVKGWNAIKTKLKWNYEANDCSYIVLECPEFIRDSENYGQRRKIDKNRDEI